ncbi:MAG: hypothetical protein H6510_08120 [Acidobacteria bacterium]|nr:hypothetical protein [Acidobacteriota bacterium]MCB9397765.1 hypothetical protein [Acidobacteriota bacterium]
MKHLDAQTQQAFLADELDVEKRSSVLDHLQHCRKCQNQLEWNRAGRNLALALPPVEVPSPNWSVLAKRLEQPKPKLRFGYGLITVLTLIALFWVFWPKANSWRLSSDQKRVAKGTWLRTADQPVQLQREAFGSLTLGPQSVLQLADIRGPEQHFYLQSGSLTAVIEAPPRLFFVQTPAVLAVDLGCVYDLQVVDTEWTELIVRVGRVSMQGPHFSSEVPANARCRASKSRGPQVPIYLDAPFEFVAALTNWEASQRLADLDQVLAKARPRDGMSLWHLIARTQGEARQQVVDFMIDMFPMPEPVTRSALLSADPKTLEAWQAQMEWDWQSQ